MRIALVLGGGLLAACCTQAAPVAVEPAPQAAVIIVTADGIAGFEGDVPFTLPAIERAFSGMDVVAAPGADVPAFHVRAPGSEATLFIVRPDWTRGHVGNVAAIVPEAGKNSEFQAGVSRASELREMGCTAPPGGARDGALICEVPVQAGVLRFSFPASRDDPLLEQIAYFPPLLGD